jgi:hypothetical protein
MHTEQPQKSNSHSALVPPTVYGGLGLDFWRKRPLIGMVHLQALPGSPFATGKPGEWEAVCRHAAEDTQALLEGGADAIMVENFFDAPFAKTQVPPHTIAAMTLLVAQVRERVGGRVPIGVNVLRNDAHAAIAIAHLCMAQFVRINVFVGAAVTDQGIIEGVARETLLYRRELGADVAIFADVFVKHAAQLGTGMTITDAAKDAVERGRADALIVSGTATGAPTDTETVRQVAHAVSGTPVVVGSGFTEENANELLSAGASGAIVGTGLKRNGQVAERVEGERVRRLKALLQPHEMSAL